MENDIATPDAAQVAPVANCHAKTCRWNGDTGCAFRAVEIDSFGGCMHFAPRDEAYLRQYLARLGTLSEEQINILIEKARQ